MAASSFIYPKSRASVQVQSEYIAPLVADNPIFDIFPVRERDVAVVRVTQKDSAYGLQQFRGLDGEPAHVVRTGTNVTEYEPGVYGEFIRITEKEMTERARMDQPDAPMDVSDYVTDARQLLNERSVQRKAANGWAALGGSLLLFKPGPNDTIVQQSYAYNVKTYAPTVPFNQLATAAPIAAFQTVQQYQIGLSVDYGAGATAYLNTVTANTILNNANNADYNGRRGQFGQTLNSLSGINQYWQMQNLPKLVIVDGGYYATRTAAINAGSLAAGNFQKYIPDGRIIVVGARPGNVPIGEYTMTRCLPKRAGVGAMGDYAYVADSSIGLNCAVKTPPTLEVHQGHSGMPALFYQSAVTVMTVF